MESEEEQKVIDNLNFTTNAMNEAKAQLESVDKAFNDIVANARPEDQQKAAMTVNKVKQLLAKAKAGGNIDDIVKEIYFAEIKQNKDKIKMNKLKEKTEKLLKRYPEYKVTYEGLSIMDIDNKLKNKI